MTPPTHAPPTATRTIQQQIEELRHMPVSRLRERYADAFGEPTTSGNRQWLFRRVAWRIQSLAEGDLSERARRRAAELARDVDVRVRPPSDGESAEAVRPGNRLVTITGRIASAGNDRLPAPGSVLRRAFKGADHEVTVLPNGFEYDGKVYRSLSAVATAITGSHWNGFLFFGLNKKGDA
ncbi:MAG: DUF2924 domain-containing protein [Phycisphaerales bacterium]